MLAQSRVWSRRNLVERYHGDLRRSIDRHGKVVSESERGIPKSRREMQEKAPRPHRREALRSDHSPTRVSPSLIISSFGAMISENFYDM